MIEARDEHDTLEGIPPPAATLELRGHEGPMRALHEARGSGRLPHAWLLQGPRGIGKATAAFVFARALLSEDDGAGSFDFKDGAGIALARQIAQGSHPGLLHLSRPANERGDGFKAQIAVDDIRRLKRFFHSTSSARQWRVVIVDPADDMNRSAANALLKILEEPPERTVFLIVNHVPGRLLPTIRSRCRVLRFEALGTNDLLAVLRANGRTESDAELMATLDLAAGSVRTALSMLATGSAEIEEALGRLWQTGNPDWQAIQSLADTVTQKGREASFEFLLTRLLKRLADDAEDALRDSLADSRRLAALWSTESERLREGAAFNLDRKQLLMTFFRDLFMVRASSRRPGRSAADA